MFTPWPPQRSGIADYAYRLVEGLIAEDVHVSVITAAEAPAPLARCEIHVASRERKVKVPTDALPIFQLGNNFAFHAFQPHYLARLGGLVHLHDPVLHHFHVDRTLAAGAGGYWNDLVHWYGAPVADACRRMASRGAPPWTNAAVTAIPLFEPYLQFADAVLVHSRVALLAINDRLPALRGYVLPQSYPIANTISELGRRGTDKLRLGVFGWIEPHKRIDQVLAAVAEMKSRGVALELEICGPAGATMRDLNAQIAAMELQGSAHLRGHLDHAALLAAIAATDVCINLRDPTMGETSAIVVQALQLGTPVIVSDTGWYSELPECVLKVSTGAGAVDALVAHLSRLDADRDELAAIAAATRCYAAAELDFGNVIARYREIIAQVAHLRDHQRAIEHELYGNVARAMADLDLAPAGHEAVIAADILRALGSCL